ncbi:fimbria/pilus outer membrane usher protein [Novilysobacter arseniciresistens]|uniref:fimbria/pilus outer membrane usher protein n=1 Tax=Novilysobacter arseniciresistens TaxID=1385522 RepID=UPI0009DF27CD|nr:fimbria/pilus outer membrane usher protein [Lysobacter arseniciresistens]
MAKPPSRRSRSTARRVEPLLLLACCLPAPALAGTAVPAPAPSPAQADIPLYLDVELNHQPTGLLLPFVLRDGRLHANAETLARLDFALPGVPPGQLLALDEIPGVQVDYDASLQRVAINAPLSRLALEPTVIGADRREPLPASNAPGLLLNYDLYANHSGHSSNATAYGELRAFGGNAGVFSTTAVTRAFRSDADNRWRGDSVRLDSSWQWSFPGSMLSLAVGDTTTGNLGWTRAIRLGGIRIGRDFGLQPYRVTTPLPAFLGEVAVPSELELYVNGIRQYSGEVPVGPFQLISQPGINGAGNAQLVITDAFGAVRTLSFPFYASQNLLAKGLSDWSVTAGVIREDYGLRSFSYGSPPVASGSLRYGVGDAFTIEAHGEGGDGLANGGIGAVWSLGRAGIVSGSWAGSDWHDQSGNQTALAYSWNNTRFNVSLGTQRTHDDYRDLASGYGQSPARASDRALVGWNSALLGSFGASYLRLRYPDSDASRYASAYWNRNFGRNLALNFSVNQNLDDSGDRSFYLGVSVNLGERRALNTSLQRNAERDTANVDLSQSVPTAGGLSWRLRASHAEGGEATALAEAGWLGEHGRVNGGIAGSAGNWYGYAGANGGLVLMSGDVFASRSVNDAFAVVSTGDIAGVPVKLENRLIGSTNDNGLLLVTPLSAWQRNRLAIDPMDLPANTRLGQVEMFAVPSDRAGTEVRFDIQPVRAAVVVLHDAAGEPLAAGGGAVLEGNPASATFVGYDGEVYLDALGDHNVLRVSTATGTCHARFDYPVSDVPIPRIGPLTCIPEEAP